MYFKLLHIAGMEIGSVGRQKYHCMCHVYIFLMV